MTLTRRGRTALGFLFIATMLTLSGLAGWVEGGMQ